MLLIICHTSINPSFLKTQIVAATSFLATAGQMTYIITDDFFKYKGGILRNDLNTLLDIEHTNGSIPNKTKYYNSADLSYFIKTHNNKLSVFSLNVNSLNCKFDELNILVNHLADSNVQIKIICTQETTRLSSNTDT